MLLRVTSESTDYDMYTRSPWTWGPVLNPTLASGMTLKVFPSCYSSWLDYLCGSSTSGTKPELEILLYNYASFRRYSMLKLDADAYKHMRT